MQFVYPIVLWALAALAIPIIIHLFHFRRFKKVYFTNVKFLKEIKEEKSTRNKLRNLLVLISRLLAYSFLVLAFAQPFISKNNQAKVGQNFVSIFIDNSNSMMASSEDVPLIDKAKKKAEEIVGAYSPSDQFQIISHELKGSQQRWISQENTVSAIDEITINPEVNLLSHIFSKQEESFKGEGNHIVYYLSDFQKSITDLEIDNDTLSEVNLVPLQAVKENNVSIDSVWFESVIPSLNQNNKLFVKVSNYGSEEKENLRVSLIQNGQTRPEGTIDIEANSSITDTINILFTEAGWQELEINIDDYPIQFDDSYFIGFNIKESTKILSINGNTSNKYLTALFDGLNQFDLENASLTNLRYDEFKTKDLIILSEVEDISSGLSGELKTYIENGGKVLLFPSARSNTQSYNNFLSSINANSIINWVEQEKSVHRINTSEFVFQNVFEAISSNIKLPITKGNFEFTNYSTRGGEFILQYRDGKQFITKYDYEKGQLYICSAPLNTTYNDLVINAEIFVPLLYKISYSTSQAEKLAYAIGIDNYTEINSVSGSNDIIYTITGKEEFIPGQINMGSTTLLNFNNMVTEAGHYKLTLNNTLQKGLAFNYDRRESELDYYKLDELKERYGTRVNIIDNVMESDLTNTIKEKDKGVVLWRWCLILALLFLAIESTLLRFWKV